jgi:gamma-glutamyltranspeptidase/glutathione hydrolase
MLGDLVLKKGMISAPQPEAVDAGADILNLGGNAIDAAIACAFVQGVVDPLMCGIGGFGSMQLFMPKLKVHECIDFHGKAPETAKPDMWADRIEGETRDGFGFILKDRVNDIGYQSITAPGSLKAYYEAHCDYGVLDWKTILQPAIDYARSGWVVRPHVDFWWSIKNHFGRTPNPDRVKFSKPGMKLYCDAKGNLKTVGDKVINNDLADTLLRIAENGADIFYNGAIAKEIINDMDSNGALLTINDLKNYRTKRSSPLWGNYRGYDIATNNPPGGGIMLIQMLNILENFDLLNLGHNRSDYVRIVCEAMKRATIDKDLFVGDPNFLTVPTEHLIDKKYAFEQSNDIRNGKIADVQRLNAKIESKDTTHVSVIDSNGNAVSMTHSLGMPSGVITPGLGFMYNGCMGVFDPRPGNADSIAPGKSRFSSMSPSIVLKNGQPFIVIGAPGGTQIPMGLLQSIINVIDFDMSMVEAVSAPRFSATSNLIDVSNRISRQTTRPLEDLGYKVVRNPNTFGFAAVHGIKVLNGEWQGAADPGHDGIVVEV